MGMSRLRALFPVLVVILVFGGVVLAQSAPPQTKPQASPAPVDEFLKGTVAQDMPGLTQPVLTKEVKPKYTPDAMRAKIQGRVKIQMVVATDGTVDRARVVESLDAATGLDAAALAAAKQYVFTPAKLRDRVVPVAVDVYLEFRLH
jgi:TonB family protein